jgi:hypothetical protein
MSERSDGVLADTRRGGLPDRPARRGDQLTTRADPRFTELRGRIYAQIQKAKVPS